MSITQHDLIEVLGAETVDSDALSDADLLTQQYPQYELKVGAFGIVQAGAPHALNVGGARAINQLARYASGVRTDATTVFFGHFVVSVQCQSLAQPTRVTDACRSVRATLVLAR